MSGALRAVLVTFLLFAAAAPFTNADCPDATIRCRIALSDLSSLTVTSGCSAGGSGGAEGDVAMVSIDGQCYRTETESDDVTFVVAGTLTMGQCYDLLEGGCQPENCKNRDSSGAACNKRIAMCTPQCTAANEGADCPGYANANQCGPEFVINGKQVRQLCPFACNACSEFLGKCEPKKVSG